MLVYQRVVVMKLSVTGSFTRCHGERFIRNGSEDALDPLPPVVPTPGRT
jgi:hypothetical protein